MNVLTSIMAITMTLVMMSGYFILWGSLIAVILIIPMALVTACWGAAISLTKYPNGIEPTKSLAIILTGLKSDLSKNRKFKSRNANKRVA